MQSHRAAPLLGLLGLLLSLLPCGATPSSPLIDPSTSTDGSSANTTCAGIANLPAFPNWTAEGENLVDSFGFWVDAAGDVNGDGYDDAIIGAPWYPSGIPQGRAYVYQGSASGLNSTPNWTATGEVSYDYFGRAAATAGDVNDDGYDDVIVGARGYDGFRGKAYVYYGAPSGLSPAPDWTAVGENTNDQFGSTVATAGDVNGDGYDDVIIGSYGHSGDRGKVYVYYGSPSGLSPTPNWAMVGENGGDNLGISAATAGDVNGDGYADIVMAAWQYGIAQGKAYVCHGSATGLCALPNWTAFGENSNDYFGRAVGTAGDVNNDGYADVIVTAHNYPNTGARGKAYVYHGSSTGLSVSPDWTAVGENEVDRLGRSVGSGDVNDDGYSDVVLGAYYYPNGGRQGSAYIYHGSSAGLELSPAWMAAGENNGDSFGKSVAIAGNVNGDCYDDVMVGAYNYASGTAQGKAYAYHGMDAGVEVEPLMAAQSGEPSTTVTYTLRLTNTGTCSDTYAIDIDGNLWPTGAPTQVGPLAAGIGEDLQVTVEIPGAANDGDLDVVNVAVSSWGDGAVSATSILTTAAVVYCEAITGTGFAWTPLTPIVGEVVTFTASASGTEPISFTWKFEIANSNLEFRNPITYVYTMAGTYTVTLTATNGCGVEVVWDVVTVVATPPDEWRVYLPIVVKYHTGKQ